ncbi:MAG: zinc-binding alcohol dehydrogenase [Anaerolineales bacterium]
MTRRPQAINLIFRSPRRVTLRSEPLPSPAAGQVEVETALSAISAGTEMLIYRGLAPVDVPADEILPSLSGPLTYPLRYGYACVGQVAGLGEGVDPSWLGRRVFAFHPHADRFVVPASDLLTVPDAVPNDRAVFLPQAETALGLIHDGAPLLGERICVLGQGIVGLLVCAVLARIPLVYLLTFDRFARRRDLSLQLGAQASLDPSGPARGRVLLGNRGADLSFELSGDPTALDMALALTGYCGRVVLGSWYGRPKAQLDLGGAFHRSRIRILSSQVSRIDPALTGRWDKARRFDAAWELLGEIKPEAWISHRVPFSRAASAYQMLDRRPQDALQVVLSFGE